MGARFLIMYNIVDLDAIAVGLLFPRKTLSLTEI